MCTFSRTHLFPSFVLKTAPFLPKIHSMKTPRILRALPLSLVLSLMSSFAIAQSARPLVTGIKAEPSSSVGRVLVSWVLPADLSSVSSLRVYRTVKPVTRWAQIEGIAPAGTVARDADGFVDKVESTSVEYYYCVVTMLYEKGKTQKTGVSLYYDEQFDENPVSHKEVPLKLVLAGVNSTVEGSKSGQRTSIKPIAQVERERKEYEDKLREQPLAMIDILDDGTLGKNSAIKPETKRIVSSLLDNPTAKAKPLDVYIFEEDLYSPAGGDEYFLFEILRKTFIKKKYEECITSLKQFLARNRKQDVADRAAFYLGESYYFTGNFPLALTQFLSLEEAFPELSRKWAENTLDLYTIDNESEMY